MSIRNNAKHVAYLRRIAKAARADGQPRMWFLVIRPDTGEAILHLDDADIAPETFATPLLIRKRFRRYKALDPDSYADFLTETRTLVSAAGTAVVQDGRFVFTASVRKGRAKKTDVVKALKAFRFLKATLGEADDAPDDPTDTLPPETTAQADLRTRATGLFRGERPTPRLVLRRFQSELGGVDGLEASLEALRGRLDRVPDDAEAAAALRALEGAWEELDTWDADVGVLGLQQGLAFLLDDAQSAFGA